MVYDIAVVGGGPAGLSAVVTARVRNKSVVLFEANGFAPRLRKAQMVHNYLGMPAVSGEKLMRDFVAHAQSFDPAVVIDKVVGISEQESGFVLATSREIYEARTIILATGVPRSEALRGEEPFLGKGVSYCATCDGFFYKGKNVAVISALPNALEEVAFLAELCNTVYFLPQYELRDMPVGDNIILVKDKPTSITGTDKVTGLRTEGDYLPVQGVFILRDSDPIETLLPSLQLRGKSILVDEKMATNIDGIFAAGDCTGQPWQIMRATGQGLIAALAASSFIAQDS